MLTYIKHPGMKGRRQEGWDKLRALFNIRWWGVKSKLLVMENKISPNLLGYIKRKRRLYWPLQLQQFLSVPLRSEIFNQCTKLCVNANNNTKG